MKRHLQVFPGLLVLVAFAATAVFAVTPRDPAVRAAKRFERIQQRLNLTPDQASRLKPIYDRYVQQREADVQANRDKVRSVLTPEQQAQLDQAKAQRKAARASGQTMERGKFPRLNLTDEQKAQLKALRQSSMEQAKSERQQFLAQAGAVLNAEQTAQLTRMMSHRHGRCHGRHGKHGHGRNDTHHTDNTPTGIPQGFP